MAQSIKVANLTVKGKSLEILNRKRDGSHVKTTNNAAPDVEPATVQPKRKFYSATCEHDGKFKHEIANHYLDLKRGRMGRKPRRQRLKRKHIWSTKKNSCAREIFRIPCFIFPR